MINEKSAFAVLAAAGLAMSASAQDFFYEGFEDVQLGESVDEPQRQAFVWTRDVPAGWDNSGSSAVDPDPIDSVRGRFEWETFAITDITWWSTAVDTQRRGEFSDVNGGLASGNVAVADPDEWDDQGNTAGIWGNGGYDVRLLTPAIAIPADFGVATGDRTLTLTFASSWRPEDEAANEVVVIFDDNGDTSFDPFQDIQNAGENNGVEVIDRVGNPKGSLGFAAAANVTVTRVDPLNDQSDAIATDIEITEALQLDTQYQILDWQSNTGGCDGGICNNPAFHPNAPSELVTIEMQVPAGATTVQFAFRHYNAGNDWWWAIDDVTLSGDTAENVPTTRPGVFTIVSPEFGGVTGFTPLIDWSDAADAVNYNLQVIRTSVPEGAEPEVVLDVDTTATEFQVAPATLFTGTYAVIVRAFDANGGSRTQRSSFSAFSQCPADLDGDGVPTIFDVLLYFQLFGEGCN